MRVLEKALIFHMAALKLTRCWHTPVRRHVPYLPYQINALGAIHKRHHAKDFLQVYFYEIKAVLKMAKTRSYFPCQNGPPLIVVSFHMNVCV